jgi:REP-associated tyrosine transposase
MHNSDERPWEFHLFDSGAERAVVHRRLPHWSQSGTIAFITWRTCDSMPKAVLDRWFDDRACWLRVHGIDPDDRRWHQRLQSLDPKLATDFLDAFWNRWHDALDACQGECVLRASELAEVVADSLQHFDGDRYLLLDYVVMPNHVHLLASFPDEDAMRAQCDSWKHFTATQLNGRLQRRGRFWQEESFDHLVRSEPQFEFLRRYIALNPQRAGIKPGHAPHYSRALEP